MVDYNNSNEFQYANGIQQWLRSLATTAITLPSFIIYSIAMVLKTSSIADDFWAKTKEDCYIFIFSCFRKNIRNLKWLWGGRLGSLSSGRWSLAGSFFFFRFFLKCYKYLDMAQISTYRFIESFICFHISTSERRGKEVNYGYQYCWQASNQNHHWCPPKGKKINFGTCQESISDLDKKTKLMKFSRSRIEHFLNQERLVKDTFDEIR